jgi:hypothetical protein
MSHIVYFLFFLLFFIVKLPSLLRRFSCEFWLLSSFKEAREVLNNNKNKLRKASVRYTSEDYSETVRRPLRKTIIIAESYVPYLSETSTNLTFYTYIGMLHCL